MNLDRRLELYQETTSRNNSGQYVKAYELTDTVWGALNPLVSTETFEANQKYGYAVVQFVIRYNTAVKHSWQLKHNGDKYNVLGVLHNNRRVYTTLVCKIRDNDT